MNFKDLDKKIRELEKVDPEKSSQAIADMLNADGITKPSGKPVDSNFVWHHRRNKRTLRRRIKKPEVKNGKSDLRSMLREILANNHSVETKLRFLLGDQ